jgi:multicomponent Na+:H+ antiporter subunit E
MSFPMNRIVGGMGIAVVWVLLFGEITAANVLGGVAVAVAVMLLFPRRGPRTRHRLAPWGVARLLGDLVVQLVLSSCRVALAVIRPTPARLQTEVVQVSLSTDSELVGTLVADLITLTPGTLTLDVRHEPERLIVHALGDTNPAEVRASVHALEDRVLGAVVPTGPTPHYDGGGSR